MDYLPTGEPALRVISNFQGNIVVQGGVNFPSSFSISSLPQVSVFTDSSNVLAIQGTVYQGTDPWVISGNSSPNGPTNPIHIQVVDQCLKVENCPGTAIKIQGLVGLINGEDPVSLENPLPVSLGDRCIQVTNCGEGSLAVYGTVNSNSTIIVNESPIGGTNPLPVTLGDTCLSVQNCGEGSLSVIGIVKIETGPEGLPVSETNPLPVSLGDTCIQVTNCGTDGVLNVSGNITVEGVAVTVSNPFPVDLTNTCLSVQNCEGTTLQTELILNSTTLSAANPLPIAGTVGSTIIVNELLVGDTNPLPVTFGERCIQVTNCGEGSLSVSGTVEIKQGQAAVDANNPLWTNVAGCVSVQNCAETILDVNVTNTCLSVQNCGEGSLSVIGIVKIETGLEGLPVSETNPLPVSLGDTCIQVTNCGTDGVLNVSGMVQIQHGELPVGLSNPLSTNVLNCVKVTNCDESVLNVSGNITVEGVAVTVSNPFPVDLRNTCIGVQNCEGTVLQTELSLDSAPVNAGNPLPVTGTVTIDNTCISVQNCGEGSLSIIGQVQLTQGGDTVSNANPLPVTGIVTVAEAAGNKYAFNNHAAAVHRGWVMDDTMRPVVSVRVTDTGTTINDIIEIIEYEIGNNNANQSTIIYEWYEGPLTIIGAAIPSWTNLGTKIQYRVYQDRYSSNQGNTFSVPTGTYMRHSGIIIGKNTQGDEGPASMHGGGTPNMLTLCMKRVDNGTELDVWFAFTIKELA
ncbi:MAG: hypothetical protein EBS53_11845 [Bacteroidetes bacterium]|nr:hypothetical protein [Bacteroidota bacterium]